MFRKLMSIFHYFLSSSESSYPSQSSHLIMLSMLKCFCCYSILTNLEQFDCISRYFRLIVASSEFYEKLEDGPLVF